MDEITRLRVRLTHLMLYCDELAARIDRLEQSPRDLAPTMQFLKPGRHDALTPKANKTLDDPWR